MLETPVAFLIFNRPNQTRRVFESIASQKPSRLLVVADGPKSASEREACEKTRSMLEQISWPCQLETHFSDVNLGCKKRVSSGLDWVFSRVEEAIILEDDCLPHPSFFGYCSELLERYRDDERVMMISGNNFQNATLSADSYYFSRYTHIWGWASWRRAWKHYDVEMKGWPAFRDGEFLPFEPRENAHWRQVFNHTHAGEIDTWDYQWHFATLAQNGLTILPSKNLVSNLGFGPEATHTKNASPLSEMETFDVGTLRHPPIVAPHRKADCATFERVFSAAENTILSRVGRRIRKALPKRMTENTEARSS